MESLLEVTDLMVNKCYTTAVERLTKEIKDSATPKLHYYRAICHSELGDFDQAIKDLDACQESHGHTATWLYRNGVAQFMTDDFSNALISFKRAEEHESLTDSALKRSIQTWIIKSELELGSPHVGNINDSIYLKTEATTITPPKAELESAKVEEGSEQTTGDGMNIKDVPHDWYQNNDFVFLTVLKKKDAGEWNVTIDSQDVFVYKPDGKKIHVQLANHVDLSGSVFTQTEKKVEIKLKKADHGIVWSALIKGEIDAKPKEFTPSYPTSNPNKKDWSKVDRNIEKEFIKEKPEGDDAMNNLLKQIYSGSDEETRRAMIKSYQTSNGTVLSTNWGEVKEKDYEGKDYVAPPDHFEAKKPEY
jgi:tetratricopeptide (TPR) repeat protein